MNNDIKPLMFIDTIQINVKDPKLQKTYDSRYHQVKTNPLVDDILYHKIKKMLDLTNHHHLVKVKIIMVDNTYYEGLIFKLDNDILIIKQYSDLINLNINNILDIIVINIMEEYPSG